ncbi:outer membrane protein [Halobacteroides halobius DSM 5150]|uniref:Outer membrane protein n=1 Tax=Halobacteroides halobius (strain ATCC 35273 / DSM 5150 / MD-1) TaxID=748449 RepID=L0KBF0_HALHC|nr:OmpH family outer membrane protein [Halobacteroides halobius]AGB42316.1 outer membrane protein [Halobacteroides halobius DSM 5150]
MKKRIMIVTSLLFAIVLTGVLINQPVKAQKKVEAQIGYVNMQKLFNNHPGKKASEVKLQQEAKSLQKKLEVEAKDLSKEKRQQLLQKYQQQLSELERELVGEVMKDINQKIRQVAQEKEITIVVDKSAVLAGGYNLTDEVLNLIEAETEDKKTDEKTDKK